MADDEINGGARRLQDHGPPPLAERVHLADAIAVGGPIRAEHHVRVNLP